jgi:hypothetical protein
MTTIAAAERWIIPAFSGEILQESNLSGAPARRSLEEMVP